MNNGVIAYFSMEIALSPDIPTYSGGLGALAGDTIRSATDLNVPMVAVSLLHRKGYFYQTLDKNGVQSEEPQHWVVEDFLEEMPGRATVTLEDRTVSIRAWKYVVKGVRDRSVPVYLLDTDVPENSDWDRNLTQSLYGGDEFYRFCQEVILGIGGVLMLRVLGHDNVLRFHMNEGHAALLTFELLKQEAKAAGRDKISKEDILAVREHCVFTTHTPVPAGHDKFPMRTVRRVLGPLRQFINVEDAVSMMSAAKILGDQNLPGDTMSIATDGYVLNMTYLALNLSHYVNGVAKRHREVSALMFADYVIDAITNGVHAATWTSPAMQKVFDRHIPNWRDDNFSLRSALKIPSAELWQAHTEAKQALIHRTNRETNAGMDKDCFTIGFARRATGYKRPGLLLTDPGRLKKIAADVGPLQVIYAGKAHPHDNDGKAMIQHIFRVAAELASEIKIAYLENYDLELAGLMTAGADVWLNTPQPPNEASGTSGMKAALNGVPSLSTLDGWWVEGSVEGITGWSIGSDGGVADADSHAESLYAKLETDLIPLFYNEPERWIEIMRHCIALNGSFFNTQRMMQEYVMKAYFV